MDTIFFLAQIGFALFIFNWVYGWTSKRDLRTDIVAGFERVRSSLRRARFARLNKQKRRK